MSNMNGLDLSKHAPTIAGEVQPMTGAAGFVAPTSGRALRAFREGKIAGTHAAEEADSEAILYEVVGQARERYPEAYSEVVDSAEFMVGSTLAAYQVMKAREGAS